LVAVAGVLWLAAVIRGTRRRSTELDRELEGLESALAAERESVGRLDSTLGELNRTIQRAHETVKQQGHLQERTADDSSSEESIASHEPFRALAEMASSYRAMSGWTRQFEDALSSFRSYQFLAARALEQRASFGLSI